MSDDAQSRPPVRPFLASHDEGHDTPLLPSQKPESNSGDFAGIPSTAHSSHDGATTKDETVVESPSTKAETNNSTDSQPVHPTILESMPTKSPHKGVSSLDVQVESITPPMPHYARKPIDKPEEDLQGAAMKGYTSSSTKKARMSILGGTIAVAAIAVGVYSLNQDIYSLKGDEEAKPVATIPSDNNSNKPATLAAVSGRQTLTISVDYLPQLSQGHYQLWLEQDGQTTSLGSFSINSDGKAMANNKAFSPEATFTKDPASLFITIESEGELATKPSGSIIATGSLNSRTAELSFDAIDLSKIGGTFVLAAPSDLTGQDQRSGLWFAKTDGSSLTGAGLDLPTAPAGWVYEGQIIHNNQIVAMGRFADPAKADSMTKFTPNPSKVPQLPGEDYLEGAPSRLGLDFPTNMANGEWKVLISLEPDNNGQDPSGDDTFAIHLLGADIAADSEAYKEYPLKTESFSLPKVTITIK